MRKILVVDDNQLVCKIVELHLGKLGWEVETCVGPFGVLNKIREFEPSIVMLDINMPGLNGEKVARLLKSMDVRSFKVVVFSSEPVEKQNEFVEKGLACGYFVKNHTLKGLHEMLLEVSSESAVIS